jgi:hypothetical protein
VRAVSREVRLVMVEECGQSIYLLCKTTESPNYKGYTSRRAMSRWGLFLLGTNFRIVNGFSTLYIHEYFLYCLCIFRKSIMRNLEIRLEINGEKVRLGVCVPISLIYVHGKHMCIVCYLAYASVQNS